MMKKLLFYAFSLNLYLTFVCTLPAKLDTQEVKVLKEIGEKLGLVGKKKWNFDKDPCSDEGGWDDYVICDCFFYGNTSCRVTQIVIASENVSTALPSEFNKLQYLQTLDLSRNLLTGTIPSEWATMSLRSISLFANKLSGPFPLTLTKVITLQVLSIEGNRFSGPMPKEIANLKNLVKLDISSNDFTGQLPTTLSKLTKLTNVRISDNNFTGRIPNFISQWTQIWKLHIQGCSFEGPIPSSISVLTQLKDLISDLKGEPSIFPSLKKMLGLNILVLRSCLINGTIPNYFTAMIHLTIIQVMSADGTTMFFTIVHDPHALQLLLRCVRS